MNYQTRHHRSDQHADLFGHVPPDDHRAGRAARPMDIGQIVRAIWHSGSDPRGTLTEDYLAALDLPLPDELCGRIIRHHASLHFAKDQRKPGMLALLRDLRDDRAAAVVRIYLDDHARKITQRLLGPAFRAAAKLTENKHAESGGLHVTLGVEAGIGALIAGHRPIWTFGNAEALARLPLVAGVQRLTIVGNDGDAQAVETLSARWRAAGREVVAMPARPP